MTSLWDPCTCSKRGGVGHFIWLLALVGRHCSWNLFRLVLLGLREMWILVFVICSGVWNPFLVVVFGLLELWVQMAISLTVHESANEFDCGVELIDVLKDVGEGCRTLGPQHANISPMNRNHVRGWRLLGDVCWTLFFESSHEYVGA